MAPPERETSLLTPLVTSATLIDRHLAPTTRMGRTLAVRDSDPVMGVASHLRLTRCL